MNTLIVRPATAADLPALALFGGALRPGMAPTLPLAAHEWLLVAEDKNTLQLAAAVRLRPAIGLTLPRFWYHVGCTVHAAPGLALFHRQRTLLLGNDHTGASELADLAWRDGDLPLAEQAAALRLVVDAALLAAARRRDPHGGQLIAELPGVRDAAGQSPFWLGLGRHFYAADPRDAQALHGDAWPGLVAALLPRHPVIAGFLPPAAQAAIAQVEPAARLLRELLEASGLRYGHHVRIDDAGPVLEADFDHLPAVTQARAWAVAGDGDSGAHGGCAHLVMNDGGTALHCIAAAAGAGLYLPAAARTALDVVAGDTVWAVPRG